MRGYRKFLLLLFIVIVAGSLPVYGLKYKGEIVPGRWIRNLQVEYKVDGKMHHGKIQIYFPSRYKKGEKARTLIALHGYKQRMSDWENRTPVKKFADKYNFVLVCPDMGTTLYESKYYKETTNRWAPVPGGVFISKILIKYLKKNFNLARRRDKTGIFGLSTGARGALLLAAKHNSIFSAAAGMSGDYDPVSMPHDRLLTSIYGSYQQNKKRWKDDDNILKLAGNLKRISVFLSHGGQDRVVPKKQTFILAIKLIQLKKKRGGYELVYQPKKSKYYQHDWRYWSLMVPGIFKFFDKRLDK